MTKWTFRSLGFLMALTGLVGCANPNGASITGLGDGQIIGGTDATGQESFSKTIVSLYDVAQGALCTASLISDSIIVTAAHCVDGANAADLRIIYGVDLESKNIVVRPVDGFQVSPVWPSRQNQELNTGDIAIVHFPGGIVPGYSTAEILADPTALKSGMTTLLAGYGLSNGADQTGSGRLRYVEVTIKNASYSKTEVLLDQTQGKGACHGDSGGPAYVNIGGKLLLWGVTSRGVDDPKNDCSVAAAYTAIPYYSQWIAKAAKTLNDRAGRTRPSQPAPAPRVAGNF